MKDETFILCGPLALGRLIEGMAIKAREGVVPPLGTLLVRESRFVPRGMAYVYEYGMVTLVDLRTEEEKREDGYAEEQTRRGDSDGGNL